MPYEEVTYSALSKGLKYAVTLAVVGVVDILRHAVHEETAEGARQRTAIS
jgi:hypothetical protein